MQKEIIVIAEILNNNLRPITFELIACAEELANLNSADIKIIVINCNPNKFAEEISKKTGYDVLAVKTPLLKQYNSDAYKNILKAILSNDKSFFICIGNTSQGLDFAPGLAVKLGCSCITGINGIIEKNNNTVFSRSVFGGKMNALIESKTDTAILTVQPGCFKNRQKPEKPGKITHVTQNDPPSRIQSKEIIKPESVQSELSDAKTIIAIGRGIEEAENIMHVEKFSHLFNDVAIACSRPVVDMGWMKYKHQVGITGSEVSPEIYIACGISGSSQHIAGMNESKFIIAINSDPNAAIFNASDICIVEDLLSFLDSFEQNSNLKIKQNQTLDQSQNE